MNNNILIIYFSYTGNTRSIAEQIHDVVGGTLFEIQPAEPYSSDYDTCEAQAKRETREGYRPVLATECDDFESYDMIFVGSPNWFNTIAPPVATFLAEHNWDGKTIVPFCTNGGGGLGQVKADIGKLCEGGKILNCLELYENGGRGANDKISKWLSDVDLSK